MTELLRSGERVLWAGRPTRPTVLTPRGLTRILFGVVWCVFALFFELVVWLSGQSTLYRWWGALIVLIGFFNLATVTVVRRRFLRTAEYLVTDQRVIMTSRQWGVSRVRARELDRLPAPVVSEDADRVGSIRFGELDMQGGWQVRRHSLFTSQFVLDFVANARQVADLIAQAMTRRNTDAAA